MAQPARMLWTVDEFLAWEATQEERYELVNGEVRMMVGASAGHNRIATNLVVALGNRLIGGPCAVWTHAQKLQVGAHMFYPDVLVTCSRVGDRDLVVEDAVLIAEVLSASTAQHDIVAKAPLYRTLPSLRHLLIISQHALQVEVYSREARGWHLETLTAPDESLDLTALEMTLKLADLYRGTEVLLGP